jgi:hypothetical protein
MKCYHCDAATGCEETLKEDDQDCDLVLDEDDNCLEVYNPAQTDLNRNGIGEACEVNNDGDIISNDHDGNGDACEDDGDLDGDGIPDASDGCPLNPNPDGCDVDGDGIPDACDNCRFDSNPGQADSDGDGFGDACETSSPEDWNIDTSIEGAANYCLKSK